MYHPPLTGIALYFRLKTSVCNYIKLAFEDRAPLILPKNWLTENPPFIATSHTHL